MAVKALTRLEANKEVRRVLVRHSVDMNKIQFSCQGKNLTLSGGLFKDNGEEIDALILEVVMQELGRIGVRISADLENWVISDGTITKKGSTLKTTTGVAEKKTVVVDVAKTKQVEYGTGDDDDDEIENSLRKRKMNN